MTVATNGRSLSSSTSPGWPCLRRGLCVPERFPSTSSIFTAVSLAHVGLSPPYPNQTTATNIPQAVRLVRGFRLDRRLPTSWYHHSDSSWKNLSASSRRSEMRVQSAQTAIYGGTGHSSSLPSCTHLTNHHTPRTGEETGIPMLLVPQRRTRRPSIPNVPAKPRQSHKANGGQNSSNGIH